MMEHRYGNLRTHDLMAAGLMRRAEICGTMAVLRCSRSLCFSKYPTSSGEPFNHALLQAVKVMAPALNRALPNSKIQRNFPRSVLYGPEQYQGMGVENPYWVEGIEHIKAIVNKIKGATDTGDLLQATIEQQEVKLGTGKGFVTDYGQFNCIATEWTWIHHTWRFISANNIMLSPTVGTLQL